MSCGGWGIGNRCQVVKAFMVHELEMNGPGRSYSFTEGDEGVVRNIIDPPHPSAHWLVIFWQGLQRAVAIPDKDFSNIRKL